MASLGARSISAVFWGAGGSVLRMLLQLVTQVVLARLLGPVEYGVFAIGSIVIGFSGFFSDVGLAYGLIQKRTVTDRDVRFVFTWQILLGGIVSLLIALGAAPIATFFGEPRAITVVQVLSVLCFINALAAPSLNLLKRNLDFKTIQLAFLISYILGYVLVGIPMALAGEKVWALVAAWIVQSSINGLWLYLVARHAIKPLFWYEEARVQSAYGGTVLATNLLNWLISNIDRVIIGRVLPSKEMGVYTITYNLVYNPASSILSVLQPVFFSASAKVAHENDNGRMARGFIALVAGISVFILPIFAAMAAISTTFVLALYGAQWADAAKVLTPLALAMPLYLVWGMSTPLLWASGNASSEFSTQWPLILIWGLSCWLLAPFGAVAVAWGALTLFALRSYLMVKIATRLVGLDLIRVLSACKGGVLLTLLIVIVIWPMDRYLNFMPPAIRLLADVLLGIFIFILGLRIIPGAITPELAEVLVRVIQRMPAGLVAKLAFVVGQGKVK